MAELDYGLLPGREMQMDWLKEYLQAYKLFTKKTEEVSPQELETLYVQVNKFALVRGELSANTFASRISLITLSVSCCDITSDVYCVPLKASHFFWGFWALIQAKYSSIDFDFLG